MNDLVGPKHVCGRDTGPGSANIEGFGEFDEIDARSVVSPQEDGDLQANSWKLTLF